MKRLLCMILTGLMLFSAACTAAPDPQNAKAPADQPSSPNEASAETEVPAETAAPIELEPIDPLPIQAGDFLDNPPIELTDPIQPVYDLMGAVPEVNGYADFSALLSAMLMDGRQNRNLSPISVYLALAMLTEGAEGETLSELLALLGCKDLEELRGVCGAMLETLSFDDGHSTLDLHNSLWMTEELFGEPVQFHDDFLAVLGKTYRSEANTVDFRSFSASKQIGEWISKQTRGKIEVSPDALMFDPATVAVLINTIYLKDNWAEPFDPVNTVQDTFFGYDPETGANQEHTVDYMTRSDRNVTIMQGDGWLRYRVRLSKIGYVSFVLPDEGIALERLLGSPEAIDKLLNAGIAKTCNVSLKIPKFSFQDKMELSEILTAMGLQLSFTGDADFSGMCDAPCTIDRVLQESYIGVDENGVEAAAYTMVTMRGTTAFNPVELETVNFHLTRPFFYAIESYDGTVLFIGTVTVPNEAQGVVRP